MQKVKVVSGDHSFSYAMHCTRDFFEVKRPGFKAAYLPGVEVKNERNNKFTAHVPSKRDHAQPYIFPLHLYRS